MTSGGDQCPWRLSLQLYPSHSFSIFFLCGCLKYRAVCHSEWNSGILSNNSEWLEINLPRFSSRIFQSENSLNLVGPRSTGQEDFLARHSSEIAEIAREQAASWMQLQSQATVTIRRILGVFRWIWVHNMPFGSIWCVFGWPKSIAQNPAEGHPGIKWTENHRAFYLLLPPIHWPRWDAPNICKFTFGDVSNSDSVMWTCFSIKLGRIIPTDFHIFSEGLKTPTRLLDGLLLS